MKIWAVLFIVAVLVFVGLSAFGGSMQFDAVLQTDVVEESLIPSVTEADEAVVGSAEDMAYAGVSTELYYKTNKAMAYSIYGWGSVFTTDRLRFPSPCVFV